MKGKYYGALRYRKTPTAQRGMYIYEFADGERVTITAADEAVTEIDVRTLHRINEDRDERRQMVTVKSAGGKVNIRVGNGTGFRKLTSVLPGTQYPFVAKAENNWFAILYGKQVGWISGDYSSLNTD